MGTDEEQDAGRQRANLSMQVALFAEIRETVQQVVRAHTALSERVAVIGDRLTRLDSGMGTLVDTVSSIREGMHTESRTGADNLVRTKENLGAELAACREHEIKRWEAFLDNNSKTWMEHNLRQVEALTNIKAWIKWAGVVGLIVWGAAAWLMGWYFTYSMSQILHEVPVVTVHQPKPTEVPQK